MTLGSMDMRKPRIGILVVAYNAEATLRGVLARIPPAIRGKIEEVFVFDDASQDRTFEVGKACQKEFDGMKLTVFRNRINRRYGGNQARGYRYAIRRGLDIVVLLHGDGQYAPEVMQNLLTPLEEGRAEMVLGSRMLTPGTARRGGMPMYKFAGNRILTWTQNRLAGTHLSEFHSGYRAYAVSALRDLPLRELTPNWHFDTQIILEFLRRGHRIAEVPIPTYYGDEICYVNGVPYAWHCVCATLRFALCERWRIHGRRPGGVPVAPRPAEQPSTDLAAP
jgi:glycosyltransferase involved in cell wall biosynthesis